MRNLMFGLFLTLSGAVVSAQTLSSSTGQVQVQAMVSGLDTPWAVDFLPGGEFLVTEREGRLLLVRGGQAQTVKGTPKVHAKGQGGLLDVMVPRDFAQSREVFLSFAKRQKGGAGTALAVGRLSQDGQRLTDVRILFEAVAPGSGGRHFGSRIVEARDGSLFLTLGERGNRPSAQELSNHNGTIVRINRDGTVPDDNPFVGQSGIRPEIWSYGHRNPQGAALDRQGRLWAVEHGAKGGDEVNRIKKGANYGWPVISYGTHYSGAKIGEGTAKPGMEQPAHYWDPSIAPSGLMIYSGKLFSAWRGDLFIGSLKFDYISRLDGKNLREVEQLKGGETERVRDVVEAPDGSIWFISVGKGTIYRISPAS
ncbi:PQQ-dependent sugar dehydrogenase [Primorskyibacter sp. S87]|uniref:PQQ-dependent sugar dehydrogenase n=1 Tax=Primorskyibacter sp. S87 TaxID=3415126 RepID=UPI003C7D10C8